MYIYVKFWSESLKETGHLEDLGIVNGEFVTLRAMTACRGSCGKVALILQHWMEVSGHFIP
jgi:hypothetical protein